MNNSDINIDWHQIQGLIHHGYLMSPHSRYIFIKFNDNRADVRSWISAVSADITYSDVSPSRIVSQPSEGHVGHKRMHGKDNESVIGVPVVNVAFTASGLKKAGLTDADMNTFPYEFLGGMDDERASDVLGDIGENSPEFWKWGTRAIPVDAVIVAYHPERIAMDSMMKSMIKELETLHHHVVRTVVGEFEEMGAFDLIDGLSNPIMKGRMTSIRRRSIDPGGLINPGEFLCGHFNERNQTSASPSVGPSKAARANLTPSSSQSVHTCQQKDDRYCFGLNGSYLVMRQLKENKKAFDDCVDKIYQAEAKQQTGVVDVKYAKDFIKAKLIGRWPDGTAMVDAPCIESKKKRDTSGIKVSTRNDFGYRDADSRGFKCPLGAHIRRAFPRDALGDSAESSHKLVNRRRILRRGRNYYSDAGASRTREGIMFLCFNAHIGKQFEFVQGSWLNDEKFAGPEREVDPVIGVQHRCAGEFSVQQEPVRKTFEGLAQFVDVLGGSYFFLPSRNAIAYLMQ